MRCITIITGTRGSGKSMLAAEVASQTPGCVGVIAEKRFDSAGLVIGYDARLLPSGVTYTLCRREHDDSCNVRHGGFWFDPMVFDKVAEHIRANFSPHNLTIIDEVGNLEIKEQSGHYPLLLWLLSQPTLYLLFTLRN